MQTISKVRIKVQETKAQKISAKDLEKILLKHFSDLMSGFYEMQTSFLSGIYKRYGNIEAANIILSFAKNTHLEIIRQRERNLDYNISLENFWNNLNIINKPTQKIISVSRITGIPKETVRRKIRNLTTSNSLSVNKNTKEFYWNLLPKNKNSYYKIISEEIEILSKFTTICAKCLNLNLNKNMIRNEIELQFSFYWYHFLSCQLSWLKMWQDNIKDVDLLLITLQAVIPSLRYINKNQNIQNISSNNIYTIVGKIDDSYNFSETAVSAASISEVTGIPRATCTRKIEKLIKFGMLKKDIITKRYYINQATQLRTKNILTQENMLFAIQHFSEYLAIIINTLLRRQK